jgi:hypothetical protein
MAWEISKTDNKDDFSVLENKKTGVGVALLPADIAKLQKCKDTENLKILLEEITQNNLKAIGTKQLKAMLRFFKKELS